MCMRNEVMPIDIRTKSSKIVYQLRFNNTAKTVVRVGTKSLDQRYFRNASSSKSIDTLAVSI